MSEIRTLIAIAFAVIAPAVLTGCPTDDGEDTDVEETDAPVDTDDTDAAA